MVRKSVHESQAEQNRLSFFFHLRAKKKHFGMEFDYHNAGTMIKI